MVKTYIHYGSTHFDANRFMPIKNRQFIKCSGGLWASPIDAKRGWREWCEGEQFELGRLAQHFTFTLKDNANVVYIDSIDKLNEMPELKGLDFLKSIYCIDFEKLVEMGVDAVEISISECPELYWALYGWDCDSIIILNKDVIVEKG